MFGADWQRNPPLCDLVHALAVWAGAVEAPKRELSGRRETSLTGFKAAIGEM